jgi:high affinity sulfate transporter 1
MNTTAKKQVGFRNIINNIIPMTSWLPNYQKKWLRVDIIAGLAVWAMTVPQVLAYAGIAGVPPIYGLYTVPLAMILYAIFGSSRTLSVGPESAIAIISAVSVSALVTDNLSEYLILTSMLTLLVGILFLLFGFFRLGWLANFLSKPVLQGFTMGIALIVISSQVPLIFGTEAGYNSMVKSMTETIHTGFFVKSWSVIATLSGTNLVTMAVGLGALLILFAFKSFKPTSPYALIVVLIGILAVYFLNLTDHGVSVIGAVDSGLGGLKIPDISMDKIGALIPGALAILLLGYSVSLSVASISAETTGEQINPNQELIGLGFANIGAAFSSGFVVSGSLSRGVVIRRAGGRTQVVSIINAILIIVTLLFAISLFFYLPYAVLAAIVIQAMSGLLNFKFYSRLYKIDRGEFAFAMVSLFGVLIFGILEGVALGVILSLALLIKRVSRPGTAILGRVPETNDFRDVITNPEAETVPGLLIFRFDGPIIFVNAGFLVDEIRRIISSSEIPVKEVLIPAHQINHLDSTGADIMSKLKSELDAKGILLSFAEVKMKLQEAIYRTGLENIIGKGHFFESIGDGVKSFQQRQKMSNS